MTEPQETELLTLALRAAAEAVQAIMEVYQADADMGVIQKADNTPVTRADMASNERIVNVLSQSDIPILSEETAHEEYAVRSNHRQMWVVDPLDGTKEFIKRNDMFSVCIALVEEHRPTLGVIAIPTTGTVYFTQGGNAWRGALSPLGEVLSPIKLPITFGPTPHVVLGSVSHPGEATRRVVDALSRLPGWDDVRLVPMGSSIKQCMIAEGSASIYPRSGTTMEWDTAAGQAIIEAAGGKLLNVADSSPVTYNRPDLRNPDFVAVSNSVTPSILSAAIAAVAAVQ